MFSNNRCEARRDEQTSGFPFQNKRLFALRLNYSAVFQLCPVCPEFEHCCILFVYVDDKVNNFANLAFPMARASALLKQCIIFSDWIIHYVKLKSRGNMKRFKAFFCLFVSLTGQTAILSIMLLARISYPLAT